MAILLDAESNEANRRQLRTMPVPQHSCHGVKVPKHWNINEKKNGHKNHGMDPSYGSCERAFVQTKPSIAYKLIGKSRELRSPFSIRGRV